MEWIISVIAGLPAAVVIGRVLLVLGIATIVMKMFA